MTLNYSVDSPLAFTPVVESQRDRDRRLIDQRATLLLGRPIDAFPVLGLADRSQVELPEHAQDLVMSLLESIPHDDRADSPLLVEVARRLNGDAGRFTFPRTDDFVVFCCTWDGDDLERDLLACLPERRVALFRSRGWL